MTFALRSILRRAGSGAPPDDQVPDNVYLNDYLTDAQGNRLVNNAVGRNLLSVTYPYDNLTAGVGNKLRDSNGYLFIRTEDRTPDALTFASVTVARGQMATSAAATVSGAGPKGVPVSVSTGASYQIGSGPWQSKAAVAFNGDQIRVRGLAPRAFAGQNVYRITVGNVSTTFTAIAEANPGYDPDAQDVFDAMTTQLTAGEKTAANTFILALKSAGIWSKLDMMFVLAAPSAQAAGVNWTRPFRYTLTLAGVTTYMDRRGYTGNGTSGRIFTSLAPFTPAIGSELSSNPDSHFVGVYMRRGADTGAVWGATDYNFFGRPGSQVRLLNQSGGQNYPTENGFVVAQRTSVSALETYRNGSLVATGSGNRLSDSPFGQRLSLLSNGTSFSAREMSAVVFGSALSQSEHASLFNALQAYLNAIGAAIGPGDTTAPQLMSATSAAVLIDEPFSMPIVTDEDAIITLDGAANGFTVENGANITAAKALVRSSNTAIGTYGCTIRMTDEQNNARTAAFSLQVRAYEPEALTLYSAFTVAPVQARRALITDLISDLKAAGVWDGLDGFWIFAAHDKQAATLNWKNPAQTCVLSATEPTFLVDRHFAGNGTSAYITGPVALNTDGLRYAMEDAHFSYWIRNSIQTSVGVPFGTFTSAGAMAMNPRGGGNTIASVRINDLSGFSGVDGNGIGLHSAVRVGLRRSLYRGGVSKGGDNTPPTGVPTAPIVLLAARENNGAFSAFTAHQVSMFSYGASRTAEQEAAYNTAIRKYLLAVGATT